MVLGKKTQTTNPKYNGYRYSEISAWYQGEKGGETIGQRPRRDLISLSDHAQVCVGILAFGSGEGKVFLGPQDTSRDMKHLAT